MKGKPWTREDEKTLVEMTKKGKSVDVISGTLGKTEDSIYMKLQRFGCE